LPVSVSARLAAQGEAKAAKGEITPAKKELRPSAWASTKVKEGRPFRNAIQKTHSGCKLLKLFSSAVLMFLSLLPGVWKEAVTSDSLQKRATHRRRRTSPKAVEMLLCIPKTANELGPPMGTIQHFGSVGVIKLWAKVHPEWSG